MYKTEFLPNKIYNYKTYSDDDGTKVLMERKVKYLFGYAQKYQYIICQHFIDTKLKSFKDYKSDCFGKVIDLTKIKKSINDGRCRYILCEEEVVTYTVTGKVHSTEKKVITYDKLYDALPKLPKSNKSNGVRLRTLYKKKDSKGISYYTNGAIVSLPDMESFSSVKYGRLVKMQDSLEISDINEVLCQESRTIWSTK